METVPVSRQTQTPGTALHAAATRERGNGRASRSMPVFSEYRSTAWEICRTLITRSCWPLQRLHSPAACHCRYSMTIPHDNTTLAVARICGDGTRERTRTFAELQSHYLFDDKFGRPAKGNDKGHVEGAVGYGRRNFMVPAPRFESFDALNAWLEEQCLRRQNDIVRGHSETIGARMVRDLNALMALPPTPYDICEKVSTRATSISMVRYRNNDYSVPVAFAHHEVQVRGYVHEVVIGCGPEVIARHKRSYDKADMIFEPMQFLPLLEKKAGALDPAAPLQGWDLPDAFATLHRLLEARMGQPGKAGLRSGLTAAGKLRDGSCPWRRAPSA